MWLNIKREGKIFLIFVILLSIVMPVLFALMGGFCNINSVSLLDKKELARLLATLTFPLTGVLVFVLTQALTLREKYDGEIHLPEVTAYTIMCWVSAFTIVECVITSLFSIQYFKTFCDVWLIIALGFALLILGSLIFSALIFCAYTLTEWFK